MTTCCFCPEVSAVLQSRGPSVAAKLGLLAWVVGLELVPYAARHFAGFTDAGLR